MDSGVIVAGLVCLVNAKRAPVETRPDMERPRRLRWAHRRRARLSPQRWRSRRCLGQGMVCQLSRHEAETGDVGRPDRGGAPTMMPSKWARRSRRLRRRCAGVTGCLRCNWGRRKARGSSKARQRCAAVAGGCRAPAASLTAITRRATPAKRLTSRTPARLSLYDTLLERLPQDLQDVAAARRPCLQAAQAVVGQRHLARQRHVAPATPPRVRDGMGGARHGRAVTHAVRSPVRPAMRGMRVVSMASARAAPAGWWGTAGPALGGVDTGAVGSIFGRMINKKMIAIKLT
jgi:hypothetical protein